MPKQEEYNSWKELIEGECETKWQAYVSGFWQGVTAGIMFLLLITSFFII